MRFETTSDLNLYTFPSNFKLQRPRASTDESALRYIIDKKSSERISVVSYSRGFGLFFPGCTGRFDDEINRLRNLDVLVVAASGNDFSKNKMGYPACNNNVVSVGALHNNGNILGKSNSANGLDFLADGVIGPIPPLQGVRTGTSIAAPRVATYLGRLRIRNPTKSMFDIWQTFEKAGVDIRDPRNGVTANRAYESDFLKADEFLKSGQVPGPVSPITPPYPPVPQLDMTEYLFGEINTGAYGKGFGSDVHTRGYAVNVILDEVANTTISSGLAAKMNNAGMSEVNLPAQASISCGSMYQLKLQAYDIDFDGEIHLAINGRLVQGLKKTGDKMLKTQTIEFCGSRLKVGKNLIEFRKQQNLSPWGVKNIVLEFLDRGSINLTVGRRNSGSYGYGFGSNQHRSQLVASFTKPNNNKDLIFTVTGWDIDRADETRVYLNDKLLGFLSKKCSSCFNDGDKFIIESKQFKAGKNQMTFIQRSPDSTWNGFQDEKWGVTDLLIREKGGNIVPILQLLLLDE